MVVLNELNSGWTVFFIVLIFAIIGVVVFVLRKKIPGLTDYQDQNDEEIAQDNLSRILVDVDEVEEKKDDSEGK